MAWGTLAPKTFGQFWLNIDYVDWGERLKVYYESEMSDSERAKFEMGDGNGMLKYRYYTAEKLIRETGTQLSDFPPFSRVRAHEVPQVGRVDRLPSRAGAIIQLTSRVLAVDKSIKQIIESVENNSHQFFPFVIENKNGVPLDKEYYILHVGNYRDSVDFSESTTKLTLGGGGRNGLANAYLNDLRGVALRKADIIGAHFWRERSFGQYVICLSDILHFKIIDAGANIPKFVKMMEV